MATDLPHMSRLERNRRPLRIVFSCRCLFRKSALRFWGEAQPSIRSPRPERMPLKPYRTETLVQTTARHNNSAPGTRCIAWRVRSRPVASGRASIHPQGANKKPCYREGPCPAVSSCAIYAKETRMPHHHDRLMMIGSSALSTAGSLIYDS